MTVPSTADAFPPHVLREYALIADGERGALIGPRGEIVWMCAPRWHSDAVFAALIGGDGACAVTPEGRFVWGGYYEPGTLIWRSRWITSDAIVECREALTFPGDTHQAVVLRSVIAREGTAKINVGLDPRASFTGPGLQSLHQDELGHWHGRLGALHVRWAPGHRLRGRRRLRDAHGQFLTAVKHKLPVKVVINNNNSLGQILWEQMVLGYPEHGVRYPEPFADYAAFASANGALGIKVERSGDARAAISQALAHGGRPSWT